MIELSQDHFVQAHRLMSMGKLVHGLIHNLNSPLQNLGMDMDMIGFSLETQGASAEEPALQIKDRLKRMEAEFEEINRLIRAAAFRMDAEAEQDYLSLDDFLDQEMAFLKTNLYFKHHVETRLALDQPLPMLSSLAAGVPEALRYTLEAVVEDMERQGMSAFTLKASDCGSHIGVEITAEKGPLSQAVLEPLEGGFFKEEPRRIQLHHMAAVQAALLLERAGITPQVKAAPEHTRIHLELNKSPYS